MPVYAYKPTCTQACPQKSMFTDIPRHNSLDIHTCTQLAYKWPSWWEVLMQV